jgi:hypothetical protein
MKVLATNYFIYGDLAAGLYRLGADRKSGQFRAFIQCKGVKDANRRCRIFGFDQDVLDRNYTTETGNKQEIRIAQDGDIWFEITHGKYASRRQALAAMGVKIKKHEAQIIDNYGIKRNCKKKLPHLWQEITKQDKYSSSSWYSLSEEAYEEWERWIALRRRKDTPAE